VGRQILGVIHLRDNLFARLNSEWTANGAALWSEGIRDATAASLAASQPFVNLTAPVLALRAHLQMTDPAAPFIVSRMSLVPLWLLLPLVVTLILLCFGVGFLWPSAAHNPFRPQAQTRRLRATAHSLIG
jgi:hypothetical protein